MHRKLCVLLFILWSVFSGLLFYATIIQRINFEDIYTKVALKGLKWKRSNLQPDIVYSTDESSDKLNTTCPSGNLMYGNYCVLSPYEREIKNTSSVGLVTLCTQGTVEFLHHVVVLCHRWSAPISVAVYSPVEDYVDARLVVHLLRQCDLCIRQWINWHFFFLNQKMPDIKQFQLSRDCSSVTNVTKKTSKRRSNGTYPINVGRNIARNLTLTPFIFSIDIELYPSLDIPVKFENMLRSLPSFHDDQVWVFPVFEVRSEFRTPLTKPQLRSMFAKKQAISFHQYRCNMCHKIPNLTQWMQYEDDADSEIEEALKPLKIFTTVKRSRRFKLQVWEPFFIGTTKDPEFDIRLSWEGKQNKMQMAYEMCMRNYDFHIIENAFLVHTPGINVYHEYDTKEKERMKYVHQNNRIISSVQKDLIKKYGSKYDC